MNATTESIQPPGKTKSDVIEVPILITGDTCQQAQPLAVSVPFGVSVLTGETQWCVTDGDGRTNPVQHRVLAQWPNGSIKWMLFSFYSEGVTGSQAAVIRQIDFSTLPPSQSSQPRPTIKVRDDDGGTTVETATGQYHLGDRDVVCVRGTDHQKMVCRLTCRDHKGTLQVARWDSSSTIESGVVQAIVVRKGSFPCLSLNVEARLTFYRQSTLVKTEVTIHNPGRAKHQGGLWDLGDPGSACLKSMSLEWDLGDTQMMRTRAHVEAHGETFSCEGRFQVYQDSSGGDNWDSNAHLNRDGKVPVSFCGYRVVADHLATSGRRANPVVRVEGKSQSCLFAIEEFWQKFPSAIDVNGPRVGIHLWPEQFNDLYELQGGESNSRVAWFGSDAVTDDRLPESDAWIHRPARAVIDPSWIAGSGAVPFFPQSRAPIRPELAELLAAALNGPNSFAAKREVIDEYGWRNFGDVWADHEEPFCDASIPVVSHYNNQYDLLHGCLVQYLGTGDTRWWKIADPLARHTMSIDIYQTDQDKSAYNGGLFWHTAHYQAAGTSGHRSYSVGMTDGSAAGGGPGNEHNYSAGLMLYFYLTGDLRAKHSATGLADWVIAMDDGRQHLLGAVSAAATGLASSTADPQYHGPGRGAGNSIMVLVTAWQATGERKYLDKCVDLIRRTIHPGDDIDRRQLLNAELRWSYTVYLQALVCFLEAIGSDSRNEHIRAWCVQSLIQYARWMLANERPYLDHADRLEFPTETWAAQDLRKSVVFAMASRCLAEQLGGKEPSARLMARARELLDVSWNSLHAFPTRFFTRPVAIVLQQCYIEMYFVDGGEAADFSFFKTAKSTVVFDRMREPFRAQKIVVKERLNSPTGIFTMGVKLLRPKAWRHLLEQTWTLRWLKRGRRNRS